MKENINLSKGGQGQGSNKSGQGEPNTSEISHPVTAAQMETALENTLTVVPPSTAPGISAKGTKPSKRSKSGKDLPAASHVSPSGNCINYIRALRQLYKLRSSSGQTFSFSYLLAVPAPALSENQEVLLSHKFNCNI
jgi:hypothetical protein